MPYAENFIKILRKFENLYDDKARAREFAYREAFDMNIKTFRERDARFKKQKTLSVTDMGF